MCRFLHNDFGSEEEMVTTGSGLSFVSLFTIVKVVAGVSTLGSAIVGSAVFFSLFSKCKLETGLKFFEKYMYLNNRIFPLVRKNELKFSKFQNEFIKSSFLPKYEPKIVFWKRTYWAEILTMFLSHFWRTDYFINPF